MALAAFFLGVLVLVEHKFTPASSHFVLAFGFIAIWRYSWGALHFIRAAIYLCFVFPLTRAKVQGSGTTGRIDHVYGIICSFRIPEDQFRTVYRALISNCISSAIPATLVASVTSDSDCAILAQLLEEAGNPETIRIIVQFQRGTASAKQWRWRSGP
ncbi:MAG: hypothetical protein QM744_13555 [Mesorhizobium sp.]